MFLKSEARNFEDVSSESAIFDENERGRFGNDHPYEEHFKSEVCIFWIENR